MQDNQNNEPNEKEDIEEVELDELGDDTSSEHQEEPSNAELEEEDTESEQPQEVFTGLSAEGQKQVENLAKKVVNGEKTLEEIEKNPVLAKWAYDRVKTRTEQLTEEYKADPSQDKIQQLEEKLNKLEQTQLKEKEESEKSEAQQLVRNYWQSKGYESYTAFKKENPEFVQDYTELKKSVGMAKAAQLSLNNIIAQEAMSTNSNLRADMKVPSGGNSSRSKVTKISQSAARMGQAMGVTPEQYKEYEKLPFKAKISN
jgi:hypothetical protein